eukprot:7895593-Pyramimonas_sp.AAC.1
MCPKRLRSWRKLRGCVGKAYIGALSPPTQLEQKGLRVRYDLTAPESLKIPSTPPGRAGAG